MPLLNMSMKHGQTPEVARAHFVKGIEDATKQFGQFIQRVEWAPDRTAAKLFGPGIEVEMKVDDEAVHVTGDIPVFARFIEAPLKKFLSQAFQKQIPR